jgi:predicted DNA-binding protein
MTTISQKQPDHLAERLEQESHSRQTTKSAIVRESLEQTLNPREKKPSCYDLTKDLIGSIKGLPKDLATNPKYMEGFGEPIRKKRRH